MTKVLNRIMAIIISTLFCALLLTGCNKGETSFHIEYSVNGGMNSSGVEIVRVSSSTNSVSVGSSVYFAVTVQNGYDHTKIKAIVAGEEVVLNAKYEDGNPVVGEANLSQTIVLDYTIPTVNSNITVIIDATECVKRKVEVSLSQELAVDAKYCLLKEEFSNESVIELLPEQNASPVETVPADGILYIDYDSDLFLILNSGGVTLLEEPNTFVFPLEIFGKQYKYGDANVYHISVQGPHSFSIYDKEDNLLNSEPSVFRLATLNDMFCESFQETDTATESTYTVNGVEVEKINYSFGSSSFIYNQFYIGDKESAAVDPDISSDLSSMQKKLYLKLPVATSAQEVSAYLMNSYNGQANKMQVDVIEADGACFIVLTEEDVLQYIEVVNGKKYGFAYLHLEYAESVTNEYLKVQIDYSEKAFASFDIGFQQLEDISCYGPSFCYYNGNVVTYCFDKSNLSFDNNGVLEPYLMVDDQYTNNKIKAIKWQATYSNGEVEQGNALMPVESSSIGLIKLSVLSNTETMVIVDVDFEYEPYDSSMHNIDFSNLPDGTLLVSTDITLDINEWVSVTNMTAESQIQISADTILYYIFADGDLYLSLNENTISNTYIFTDLKGDYMSVSTDDGNISVKWLSLQSDYYANGCTFYMHVQ